MWKISIHKSSNRQYNAKHALDELCIAATKGTQETQAALEYFLNYYATHPEAEIIYRSSDGESRVDLYAIFSLYNWDGQTLCPLTDCFPFDASL
jgi:spermidine/putrescine-binding protein